MDVNTRFMLVLLLSLRWGLSGSSGMVELMVHAGNGSFEMLGLGDDVFSIISFYCSQLNQLQLLIHEPARTGVISE